MVGMPCSRLPARPPGRATHPPTSRAERDVSGGLSRAQTPRNVPLGGRFGKGWLEGLVGGAGSAEVVVEPAQEPAELGDVARRPLGQLGGDVRAAPRAGPLERAPALAGQ